VYMRSSFLVVTLRRFFVTDISGEHMGPIFKIQAFEEELCLDR